MMINKKIIFVLFMMLVCSQCSTQKSSHIWTVKDVKTNYIQKGTEDIFEIPRHLMNQNLPILGDSLIILTPAFKEKMKGSNLTEQFGDTIFLEKKVYFQRREDDELSIKYPGDELSDCVFQTGDTCKVSNNFLNILGTNDNDIRAFLSMNDKESKTRCFLFVLNDGKEMALYSDNDFLIFFLKKK